MAHTVVGLFDNVADAQRVVQELIDNGLSRDDISVVSRNKEDGTTTPATDVDTSAGEAAGVGAVSGTVMGGVVGLLVGSGLLLIPGIGPVLAAGPLAAAIGTTAATVGATALGAGLGAATGGLLGGLLGAGLSEEDAGYYAEGVRRGGTLVSTIVDENQSEMVRDIMNRHGAVDIRGRGAEWQAQGWKGFDPNAPAAEDDWRDSSKVGTAGGTVAGAATGAAMGSVAGPVGTVIGGAAGAVAGAAIGAAGDVAGERAEDSAQNDPTPRDRTDGTFGTSTGTFGTSSTSSVERRVDAAADRAEDDWQDSSKVGTAGGTAAGAATGAAMGSVAGPVGTVIGGAAGAVAGAALGAAGDVAGERAEDSAQNDPTPRDRTDGVGFNDTTMTTGSDYARGMRDTDTSFRTDDSDYARGMRSFDSYDTDFRDHFTTSLSGDGRPYDYYSPAYRFGYNLATTSHSRYDSWDMVDLDARTAWERENPNTWERFKDAVRYSWERARGLR